VSKHFLYDALVITALDREFEPYKSKFDLLPVRHFPGAYEFPFADKSGVTRKGIALSIGKSGQARAASLTQSLLVAFRPRLALMSGFCGGVAGKAKLGDLMIFESSVDWDYGKWTEEPDRTEGSVGSKSVFLSRPTPIGIDGSPAHWAARQLIDSKFNEEGAVVREVKLLSKGNLTSFSVHLAPAASGSAVVTDHAIIKRIRGLNEAIRAVDMESYGFYFACSQTYVVKPQFICVKSVADFCNGEKGDEFHEACSEISAMGVIGMLRNWTFS
jgi:nucleoside phosphorylase